MKPHHVALLVVVAAMVIFGAMMIGIVYWLRWRRKTKWPYKTDDKLLRGPGEALKVKIAYLDEHLLFEVMAGICAGLLALAFFGDNIAKTAGLTSPQDFWLGLAAMITSYSVSGYILFRADDCLARLFDKRCFDFQSATTPYGGRLVFAFPLAAGSWIRGMLLFPFRASAIYF